MWTKQELEMLVICKNPNLRRRVLEILRGSILNLTFSDHESLLREKSLKSYDLYCMTGETSNDGKIIDYMTIIY